MAEALQVRDEAQGGRKSSNGKGGNGGPGPAQAAGNWVTTRWERFRQFLHDVRVELRQVTWPTRNDVRATTAVVLVTVAFFSAYFFLVDLGVGALIQRVFDYFKK
jgi:preprotein translocase subunit SecE